MVLNHIIGGDLGNNREKPDNNLSTSNNGAFIDLDDLNISFL